MDRNSKKVVNSLVLLSILIIISLSLLVFSANFVPSKYLKDFSEHPADEFHPNEVSGEQIFVLSGKYVLSNGEALKLPEGYDLVAKQVDVEGKRVWLEVSKNGEFIDDHILYLSGDLEACWCVYSEEGNELFRVYLYDVYQNKIDRISTERVCVVFVEMI